MVRATLRLGPYRQAVDAQLDAWREAGVAHRIWAKDTSVWSPEPIPELGDRLGWLHLPAQMRLLLDPLEDFAETVRSSGITRVLLLGMGGSSLAPEVFQRAFGSADGHPSLQVLDSTHPDAVGPVLRSLEPEQTLVVVSSKSGTTLETAVLHELLWERMAGLETPGEHFVAITDPGSELEALARERGFLQIFGAPVEVGGRFSALSVFGLVPAALIGVPLSKLGGSAQEMAVACAQVEANPGLELGAALGLMARGGSGLVRRDKLILSTSPGLAAFPDWLEQLIAESTGKHGVGILPVVGSSLELAETGHEMPADRAFVRMTLASERDPAVDQTLAALVEAGHPVIEIVLESPTDLGGEIMRWEMATAAAGIVLGINPFDQPDVGLAKRHTAMALDGEISLQTDALLAAGEAPQAISALLEAARPGDYVAVQAFLASSDEIRTRIDELRGLLARRTGVAVTSGFGPRFLHSTGQLHKGGPATGIFIQLRDQPPEGSAVPGRELTLGRLVTAQAQGDLAALGERGRRHLGIDLGRQTLSALKELIAALEH